MQDKSPEVEELTKKVSNKLVRVITIDKREYLGIFGAIDKTGTLFIQDSLEVINADFNDPNNKTFYHEYYTPYLLNKP